MNLNRLSQNELDYLCDKEGDESSDSDFEVTVDHVEPASSEVIKVKYSFEVGLLSIREEGNIGLFITLVP